MNIVHVSKTALASSPYEIMKCLNKYTKLRVRWIAHRTSYADGRKFPADVLWNDLAERQRLLSEADIIHVHNEVAPMMDDSIRGKQILLQLHSVPKRMITEEAKKVTSHIYTISQPLQMRVYDLPDLPNLIDPEEYTPLPKTSNRLQVVFAPTNSFSIEKPGTKARELVEDILNSLKNQIDIDIFSNLNYEDNLRRKRNADIIIDDVVNETFHRTTLEACCFGVGVINNMHNPFWIFADKNSLRAVLVSLADNMKRVREYQKMARQWVIKFWHPEEQAQKYVEAYEKILGKE